MDIQIQQLIEAYIYEPKDALNNFRLAVAYEAIGQKASAMTLYLRASELTEDKDLQYESLLRNFLMLEQQGSRTHSALGQLYHAISVRPNRPEGFYLLSRYYERAENWQECYTMSTIGLTMVSGNYAPLYTNVEYSGEHLFKLLLGISGWWSGRCDDSRTLFRDILDNYEVEDWVATICRDNLDKIGGQLYPYTHYNSDLHEELVVKFPGSEKIKKSFAQTYQDMFILTALNGKRNGKYVEIGSGDPFYNNNTALLETEFGWKGASIEIEQELVDKFNAERTNKAYCQDAVATDYRKFLRDIDMGNEFDYLQLDCEPAANTYSILLSIPFDKYKFAVITYEHDYYAEPHQPYRMQSRDYLIKQGYKLVVSDISADKNSPYEDWWVHPDLVDEETVNKLRNLEDKTKKAEDYMLGRL
jgi:hypothetical protein